MSTISKEGVIDYHGDGLGDVLSGRMAALPRVAREKHKSIERAASKSQAAHNEINDRMEKLRIRRTELLSQVNHAETEINGGWVSYGKSDHARVEGWRAEAAECRTEMDGLNEERRKLANGFQPDRILEWIRSEPSGRRWRACVPDVSLRKNETPFEAVKTTRREINEFQEQSQVADSAPRTLEEAEADVIAQIDFQANKGQPRFARALRVERDALNKRRTGTVRWPVKHDDKGEEHGDGFALAVWANRDSIVARALEELRSTCRPDDAMTMAERDARMIECKRAILELSRREEVLICMCEADGIAISRRSEAPILAVLGIEVDPRPLPAPKPEPEPEVTEAERAADIKRGRLRDKSVRAVVTDGADTPGADPDFG
jgi:hypothetical protein